MSRRAKAKAARPGNPMNSQASATLPAAHEAAGTGPRMRSWMPADFGPRAQHVALPLLRSRSRDACRNNPIARAAVERMVSDMIGNGVSPKPLIKDEALRLQIIELWEAWSAGCDMDGQTDFYGLQSLLARSWLESGEVFVLLVPTSSADAPAAVPLQLRVLESDHVPMKNERLSNGNRIVDGVEFDDRGRRVAYWIHPSHPGDGQWTGSNEPRRHLADRVLHLFEAARPGQVRGVPFLASVLTRIKNLDDFDDAQLERQKLANLIVGFITNPPPDPTLTQIGPDGNELDDINTPPPLKFKPGTFQELMPGQSMEFAEPFGTTSGYVDFVRQQLTVICAALGVPYPLVTGDYRATNDRVVRVAINEYKRRCQQLINHMLVPRVLRPVRNAFVQAAQLAGALPLDPEQAAALAATRWTPHAWAYIHPVQDVQADVLRVKNGFASRSEVLLERGFDAELIDQEIAADHAREASLGLRFDSPARDLNADDGDDDGSDGNDDDGGKIAEGDVPLRRAIIQPT